MKRPYVLSNRIAPERRDGKRIWYAKLASWTSYKSTGTADRGEAEHVAQGWLEAERAPQELGAPLFGAYAAGFFALDSRWSRAQESRGYARKENTLTMREKIVSKYLEKWYRDTPIDEIRPADIERRLLAESIGNSMRNQILYTARIITSWAAYEGVVERNPLAEVHTFETTRARRREPQALTGAELEALFPEGAEDAQEVWSSVQRVVFFETVLSAGLRLGEARGLHWDDVAWGAHALWVQRQVDGSERYAMPKGGKTRGVLVPARLMDRLRWWWRESEIRAFTPLVFSNDGSRPVGKKAVYRWWSKGLERAGITRKLVVHDLRHTYNSRVRDLLVEAQLPDELLRRLTGHRSESMTEYYDHPDERRLAALEPVRGMLDRFWTTESD